MFIYVYIYIYTYYCIMINLIRYDMGPPIKSEQRCICCAFSDSTWFSDSYFPIRVW